MTRPLLLSALGGVAISTLLAVGTGVAAPADTISATALAEIEKTICRKIPMDAASNEPIRYRRGTCAPGYVELAFDNPASVSTAPFELGTGTTAAAVGVAASAGASGPATAGGVRDVNATASTTGGASGKQLCRRIPTAPGQRIVTRLFQNGCPSGYAAVAEDAPAAATASAVQPYEPGPNASAASSAGTGRSSDVRTTASAGGGSGKQLCRRIPTSPGQRVVTRLFQNGCPSGFAAVVEDAPAAVPAVQPFDLGSGRPDGLYGPEPQYTVREVTTTGSTGRSSGRSFCKIAPGRRGGSEARLRVYEGGCPGGYVEVEIDDPQYTGTIGGGWGHVGVGGGSGTPQPPATTPGGSNPNPPGGGGGGGNPPPGGGGGNPDPGGGGTPPGGGGNPPGGGDGGGHHGGGGHCGCGGKSASASSSASQTSSGATASASANTSASVSVSSN